MCDAAERELVCRSISFGPVDPYTKEGQAKHGANWNTVRNSYAPGGACFNSMPDNGYYASHTVPSAPDWGWKWANNTWNPPPGGDPKGMTWNGKNFV